MLFMTSTSSEKCCEVIMTSHHYLLLVVLCAQRASLLCPSHLKMPTTINQSWRSLNHVGHMCCHMPLSFGWYIPRWPHQHNSFREMNVLYCRNDNDSA